jgi:thioredoxin-like negative regulator of GroEL
MTKFTAKHWIVIGLTLLATVLLFFAPKMGKLKKPEMAKASMPTFDIDKFADSVRTKLDTKTQALILSQQQIISSTADINAKQKAFDSLSSIWQINKMPLLAAYTKVQKSNAIDIDSVFAEAGQACYMTSRFVSPNQQMFLMANAIECFNKALAKDTANANYKTSLGICYVEGSQEPMKGIMLLRSVVAADSTNIKAQLSLGMFALQSGQNDKAVKRFNSIIAMQPTNAEAYLFLAQAYSTLGKKPLAIESLEKFKTVNTDKTVEQEIDKYINDLKTN